MNDFIGVYDKALSFEFCDGIIQYFKWAKENNRTWGRVESRGDVKRDIACTLNPVYASEINFTYQHLAGYMREFNEAFWGRCYADYTNRYPILQSFSEHTIYSYKIQETHPSEGYHVWHAEQDCIDYSRRLATYILYLNDVTEGGETEFLHQSKRVSPQMGRLVIFPSSYTHTHRGNPPLSGVKYIMTGWLEFKQ